MSKPPKNFDRDAFRKEVREWLETRDRQTSVLFATRFALRAIPLFSAFTGLKFPGEKSASDIILPLFWATGSALSTGNWPDRAERAAANAYDAATAAIYAAADADPDPDAYDAAVAAATAATTADAATTATLTAALTTVTTDVATLTADAAAVAYAAVAYAAAFQEDTAWIEGRSAYTPITDLSQKPLWPDNNMPPGLQQNWKALKKDLLGRDENWQVWTNWYEDRLIGKPLNQDLELAIINLNPKKYWHKGAKITNAKIQELIDLHEPSLPDMPLEDIKQFELGAQFEPSGDRFRVRLIGAKDDLSVAQNPDIQKTHKKLKRKAGDFAELANRLDNTYGWTGIGKAAKRFEETLQGSTQDIARNIRDVWEEIVELGSFLEQDDQIHKEKSKGIDPLDPDYRRALSDLLQTGAPWLREFPTAQKLDDNIRKHKASDTEFETATDFIRASEAHDVLSQQDVVEFLALAKAAERGNVQSEKAKTSITLSGKNIAIAVAALYFAQVVAVTAPNSILVQKGGELYLQSEKIIVQMFKDGPADIRAVIQALLKELSEKENPPTNPKKPRIVSTKTTEDE